ELFRQWENGVLTEYSTGYDSDEDDGVYQFERTFSYYQNAQVLTEETKLYRNERIVYKFDRASIAIVQKTFSGNGIVIETKSENGIITTDIYNNETLKSSQNVANGLVEYIYDEFNRSIGYNYTEDSVEKYTRYTLDNNGNILVISLEAANLSKTISIRYDKLNRKIQEQTPDGSKIFYEYDANGKNTRISGNTLTREAFFDLQGRIKSLSMYRSTTSADKDTTCFYYNSRGWLECKKYPSGEEENFYYNGDSNISRIINARGICIHYTYDKNNRLKSMQSIDIYWEFKYDYRGLLILATNGDYSHSLTYDKYGNLAFENFSDIPNMELAYFYKNARYSGYSFGNDSVHYEFNSSSGRLECVICGDWMFKYSRMQNSEKIIALKDLYKNRIINNSERVYNATGDLIKINNIEYSLNSNGIRTAMYLPNDTYWSYFYDDKSRIEKANLIKDASLLHHYDYEYDDAGNYLLVQHDNQNLAYTTNNLNQYQSINDTELNYDKDGNLLSLNNASLQYNSLNQLICVSNNCEKQEYIYDYMGRRIETKTFTKVNNLWILSDKTRYVYQDWNVIAEYKNSSIYKSYIWGEDIIGSLFDTSGIMGLLMEKNCNGCFFPDYDANGNIVSYRDQSGEKVATYIYDPVGNILEHQGLNFNYLFSSKYKDPFTHFYYYGYRFYAPSISRWLSRDSAGEYFDCNLYSFVNNDPINNFDARGEFTYTIGPSPHGLSFAFSADITTKPCPLQIEFQIAISAKWEPPGLNKMKKLVSKFNVHLTAEIEGELATKVTFFECSGMDSTSVCLSLKGKIGAEHRVKNYRDARGRFARFRLGVQGGASAQICVNLCNGNAFFDSSYFVSLYLNKGNKNKHRTYSKDYNGTYSTSLGTWSSLAILSEYCHTKPKKNGCCCIKG
ncbi:MAG: RHS repeat-associated core domain-containing protein, partial [Bacteroidaceae bacterium]|nr:RHS repeat-associated core domain-containing protein [Bacteroidaceae bacterium]